MPVTEWPTVRSTVTAQTTDTLRGCQHRIIGCGICAGTVNLPELWEERTTVPYGSVRKRYDGTKGVERIIADHNKGPAVTFEPIDGSKGAATLARIHSTAGYASKVKRPSAKPVVEAESPTTTVAKSNAALAAKLGVTL